MWLSSMVFEATLRIIVAMCKSPFGGLMLDGHV